MKRLVAVVPLAMVLSACGVFGGGDATPETTVQSTLVMPSSTTVQVSTTDTTRLAERAAELFGVLDRGDAAELVAASSLVTPGSPAAVLVAHQAAVATLVAELTLPEATTSTSSTTTSTFVDTSIAIDATTTTVEPMVAEVRYGDPVFDDDGLVRSFSINGDSLDGLIREAGPVVVVEGVQGRIASVYRTAAGRVSALIDVTAADEGLTVFGFAAVHRARAIDAGSSGLTEAIGAWGVDSVPAGASTRILVVFGDGALDGEVLITVVTDAGVDLDLVLPLIAP